MDSVAARLKGLDRDRLLAVALDACKDAAGAAALGAALARSDAPRSTAPPPEDSSPGPPRKKKRKEKVKRAFDASRFATREIALWIAYDGAAYCGFAEQNLPSDGVDTVERRLFLALKKVCLVESREACAYSRCGRTDKGVSAVKQVVGLTVRSAAPAGSPAPPDGAAPGDAPPGFRGPELDYCGMLNRVLPADVRALCWRPVKAGFSARFSCASRTYRYFFSRDSASTRAPLDLAAMRSAADLLVGDHDFRNFCKMDVIHVSNFRRRVYSAEIVEDPGAAPYLEIHGQAFLWHMVRSIVSVLFLVGERREAPAVVSTLLDAAANPRRPQYLIADERPLVLHDCAFDTLDPATAALPEPLFYLANHFADAAADAAVELAKKRNALGVLDAFSVSRRDLDACLAARGAPPYGGGGGDAIRWPLAYGALRDAYAPAYRPLADLDVGKSYEERVRDMNPKARAALETNVAKRDGDAASFHEEKRRLG